MLQQINNLLKADNKIKDFQFIFSDRCKRVLVFFIFIGFASFLAGYFIDSRRLWHAFLTALLFVLLFGLGGVFFTAIQHVSHAVWSINIRRFMEACGAYIPIACASVLLLPFSGTALYSWFDLKVVAADHLLQHKSVYLNWPFFSIRLLVFCGIWIFFAKKLIRLSFMQDKQSMQVNEKFSSSTAVSYSVAFLLLFALSFSFFSFDVLMSLEPHWFSTIFGVYVFAGLFQSFIAMLILLLVYFRNLPVVDSKTSSLKNLITENHLHDLGKFLFGCTIFWAYIAFSQYMLTWYANLPEETIYYVHRSAYHWKWFSIGLLFVKFVIPFLFLLPRWVKRNEKALIAVSLLVLTAQYMDIYWMVYPHFDEKYIRFGLLEIGLLLGFTSLFLFIVFHFLNKHSLIPFNDPRYKKSSSHEVIYS